MRPRDVVERLFAKRDPDKDSYAIMAVKLGYKSSSCLSNFVKREDMYVSTLYKICKYFGYVIVIMNPNDDTGKSDMVINMKRQPLPGPKRKPGRPKKLKGYYKPKYDRYKGTRVLMDKPVEKKG